MQDGAPASTVNAPGSGALSLASLAKYDRDSCSWRTPQLSLLGGSDVFSATWPQWGMMRAGVCWELSTLAPHTNGTGCGSSLPTPQTRDWKNPQHSDEYAAKRHSLNLNEAIWRYGMAMLPTPSATLYGSNGDPRDHAAGRIGKRRGSLETLTGGVFIALREWMMGWPIGWTALEPLVTDRFRQWLGSHGSCSVSDPPLTVLDHLAQASRQRVLDGLVDASGKAKPDGPRLTLSDAQRRAYDLYQTRVTGPPGAR
jgi:hypothetical protein